MYIKSCSIHFIKNRSSIKTALVLKFPAVGSLSSASDFFFTKEISRFLTQAARSLDQSLVLSVVFFAFLWVAGGFGVDGRECEFWGLGRKG